MKNRIKAFAVHFLLSALAITGFLFFVYFIWYPHPYDVIYSTWDVLKIVVGVDLVLGPLITLIIFDVKKEKRELKRDISIIALVQILALSWGIHVTYSVRPVFLVFSNYEFYMFTLDEVDVSTLKDKTLQPAFWQSPTVVYVDTPKSKEELTQLYNERYNGTHPAIKLRSERYLPLQGEFKTITPYSLNMTAVMENSENAAMVNQFLESQKLNVDKLVFYPVRGASASGTIVFYKESGEIAGLLEKWISPGKNNAAAAEKG